MNKILKTMCLFTIVLLPLFNFNPEHTSAASYANQTITCYLSTPGVSPARPGSTYIVGTTAASQYKTYNKFSDGPMIPFGTNVKLSQTVYLPNGMAKNTFRIDDMGDKFKTRTPYFVDIYFGLENSTNRTLCTGFGDQKRMTVS